MGDLEQAHRNLLVELIVLHQQHPRPAQLIEIEVEGWLTSTSPAGS